MPAKNRGTKRVAHGDAHPVKKVRVDPMVGAVLEAIDMTQDLPESCKNMLAAMVPEALTLPAGERHSYQTMFVDIVGECVRKTEENMKATIIKGQENAFALSSKRDTLEKSIEDVKKIHCEKKTVMEHKKANLAELFRTVLENRLAVSAAQQALDAAAAPVTELKKEIEACHQVISEDLVVLRGEAVENSVAEAISSKFAALAMHLGLEETLVQSLPAACTKTHSNLGAFDVMVLEQFEKEVISKAAGFQAQIQSQTANVAELEVSLESSTKKLDETTSMHHSAANLLTQAMDEEKKAFAALRDSQVELETFEPLFKQATEAVTDKQFLLETYQTWNVASFDVLKEKPSKPSVVTESKPVLPDEDASAAPPIEDVAPQQASV